MNIYIITRILFITNVHYIVLQRVATSIMWHYNKPYMQTTIPYPCMVSDKNIIITIFIIRSDIKGIQTLDITSN